MVASVLIAGVILYVYRSTKPPPPKICGTPNGPAVTSPRIKLSDGRHLAYRERGVAKENAEYKVIVVHGFDSSKDIYLPLSQVRITLPEADFFFFFFIKLLEVGNAGLLVGLFTNISIHKVDPEMNFRAYMVQCIRFEHEIRYCCSYL